MQEAITIKSPCVAQPSAAVQSPVAAVLEAAPALIKAARPRWSLGKYVQLAAVAALSGAFALALLSLSDSLANMGKWGYLGVFVAEAVNAAVFFIPTPASAYTFTIGAVLDPLALGLIGGIGATLGELSGYYLGARGGRVVEGNRMFQHMRAVSGRWMAPALIGLSLAPFSVDVAGLWAGAVKYPMWRFLACIAPGKFIKVTAIALAGRYGIQWLMQAL